MIDRVDLLQRLVGVDTTNPPGNEAAAIELLLPILDEAGIEHQLLVLEPGRPNLVARLPGRGTAPPLLLQGHVDVVPTTGQTWTHPPFDAVVADGFVWGRGTLDMKGPLVMMLDALVRRAADPTPPAGDVILAVVADEERHGIAGARFLVESHPEIFAGVRYALGEFGAFPFVFDDTRFYPIQIAERVGVGFEVTIEGPAGHGSMPVRGAAMAKLGHILRTLDRQRLPVHLTPATRLMVEGLIGHTSGRTRVILRRLLDERTAGLTLRALGDRLSIFEPMFRNTVSPTVVRGGEAHNVIPGSISLSLDGRMLPGLPLSTFISEVERLVGVHGEVRIVTDGAPPAAEPDMGLFEVLSESLRSHDPEAVPIPFLMPAVTDGRWFAQLGIQPYGYTPLTVPDGFDFQRTVHAADERIPVSALEFGSNVLTDVLRRYDG